MEHAGVPGNSRVVAGDLTVVDCERCREAISAGLDGEAGPRESARAEEHRDGCAACRGWAHLAAVVTRRVRTGPADPGPDLVTAVLGADPRLRPACGCAVSCGCGCRQGRACRCVPQVA